MAAPLVLLALVACASAAPPAGEALLLDIGSMRPKPQLGFGWGPSEMSDGVQYRWIKRLEADVNLELESPRDGLLTVRARPQYVPYTRQTVSVLVNGKFAGEWGCKDHAGFEDYSLEIPARFWREGTNRLTFRMAYRKRVGPDRRELSLCVDSIALSLE